MTVHKTDVETPPVLGLLPDLAASRHLTEGLRNGLERPPFAALAKATSSLAETEARWQIGPVRNLFDEAMDRFDGRRVAADRWLSPRLHATVRMTRAEAADSRLWNHMGMVVAPDYVLWRHPPGKRPTQASRFTGPHHTQAFSRLWWAAEIFRNGADYGPVEVACSAQDILNTTMRLDVIDHRPTALAILRVLKTLMDEKTPDLGIHVNALSAAVNSAGSTLVYDALAPDVPFDNDALDRWIAESADAPPVSLDRLPEGPEDGAVPVAVVEVLTPLFESLLAEAPKRHRRVADSDFDEIR